MQDQLYEFGPYRISVPLSRLERAGCPIPLPPKAFDLLLLLARNPHRVVSKDELMQALWPDTFVEDANVTQHVYTLRKALGDQTNGRPYIELVVRRGYRLAAEVRTVDAPGGHPARRIEAEPVFLEGERKHAAALQCAVANAAGVIERLGSMGLHQVMVELMTIATDEISRYEGAMSERNTDGFVAVFGAPLVHEDDGRRAVMAALAIQRRFALFAGPGRTADEGLHLQMGISAGPVIISRCTDGVNVSYSAVGETMKTTALLQQFAAPGSILISETLRRAVEKFIEIEPVAIASRMGQPAYHVIGVLRKPESSLRLARSSAPLLGRDHEIALLGRLLDEVWLGHGRVVSVVGDPGMGKSRLVDEFLQIVRGRSTALTIVEGRCVSYGGLIPYRPVTELVRAYCGVDETDSPDIVRLAIDRAVEGLGLPHDAGGWLLRVPGFVGGDTTPEPISPEATKARTFEVLRLLMLKAAARRPLVIVVEDVHWVDRTSEEFLTGLIERLTGARAMVVVTHRHEYQPPWMRHSFATQLTLSPLTPADSARLVESVARERALDADATNAILSRGEGNPFFLEELTRTMLEHGAETKSVSETLHGVIMARIDRLTPASKQLLQTASVLGRVVSLDLLLRVWGGVESLDAELMDLCRQEFLYEWPGAEEPSYIFKHALTQDVAYDSLLARSRSDVHLRAARALEELYAGRLDETASTLAYHYARTDLIDDAVTWLRRAAERAARVYANAEAMLHLDLAARRAQRLPESADRDRLLLDISLRQAQSLYFLGRFRESVDVLVPHEARLARLHDPALAGSQAFWLAHMYSRLGDHHKATEHALRAIHAAATSGDDAMRGKGHGVLALEGHWSGRTDEGVAHGTESIRLLKGDPDERWWLGMSHFYTAANHLLAGRFDDALVEAAHVDEVGKDIGDPRLQTYAGYTVGWAEASRGNHDTAIAACLKSLDQAPDRVSRAYATLFLGFALLEKGEYQEARARMEPVVSELKSFGIRQWHALAATFMGESLRLHGLLDEAAGFVQCGLHVATGAQYGYAMGFACRVAGRIALDRGSAEEARTAFQEALDIFVRIGAAFEANRARLELNQMR